MIIVNSKLAIQLADRKALNSAEFFRVLAAIRAYYGSGARLALKMLADLMEKPDVDASGHLINREHIFVDTPSDATIDQEDDQPVGW